jgi:hypothetical protein
MHVLQEIFSVIGCERLVVTLDERPTDELEGELFQRIGGLELPRSKIRLVGVKPKKATQGTCGMTEP